jgi:hypothetical protein
MAPRLELQAILEALLASENVYFQPPASLEMQYPCIVYQRDNAISEFADNFPYAFTQRYQVTYIDRNPDSGTPKKLAILPRCLYNRFFAADNLNHDVFILYF